MFVGYQQIQVGPGILTSTALTIPATATGAVIQAETQNIRYTMDNATSPTQTFGMVLRATTAAFAADVAKAFHIDDIQRIRFTSGAAGIAVLNVHYFSTLLSPSRVII